MITPPSDSWNLAVCYINHAGFAIISRDGTTLLIDPFLSPTFPWEGGIERQIDPAPFRAEDLAPCAAILITHDHADHFDLETCRSTMRLNPGAVLTGPAPVLELAKDIAAPGRLLPAVPGEPLAVGSLSMLPLANRGNERDQPCPRFSYLVTGAAGASVFHSGDSHGPSGSWRGVVEEPDLALLWPAQIEDTISAIRPRKVWLMHWGRFEPGRFLCNVDISGLASTLKARFPEIEIIAEPPGAWITVRAL